MYILSTKIWWSASTYCRSYSSRASLNRALRRLTEKYPDAVNVLSILHGQDKEQYLRSNPWLNPDSEYYDGAVKLVLPLGNGSYKALAELSMK